MKNLRQEARKSFSELFNEWYESVFGEFDCADSKQEKQWREYYHRFWHESGLNKMLGNIEVDMKTRVDNLRPKQKVICKRCGDTGKVLGKSVDMTTVFTKCPNCNDGDECFTLNPE